MLRVASCLHLHLPQIKPSSGEAAWWRRLRVDNSGTLTLRSRKLSWWLFTLDVTGHANPLSKSFDLSYRWVAGTAAACCRHGDLQSLQCKCVQSWLPPAVLGAKRSAALPAQPHRCCCALSATPQGGHQVGCDQRRVPQQKAAAGAPSSMLRLQACRASSVFWFPLERGAKDRH